MGIITFIYKLWFGAVFYCLAILLFPFFVMTYNIGDPLKNGLRLKRLWTRLIQVLTLVPLKVEGRQNFPKDSSFVVVANHASYLDIVLMFAIVPGDFVFMGKSELLSWPFLSYVFGKTDIPVHRTSVSGAKRAMAEAEAKLKQGVSIIIFPEGTMPPGAPKLAAFKMGAFKLSVEIKVPVVPITFANNWKLFSDHTECFKRGKPGVSKVFVHKALYPANDSKEELISLQQQSFSLIDSKIEKA